MGSSSNPMVRLRHVEVRHRRTSVLCNLDLTLEAGVTAFVGKNGVGKSTLLRAIATLHPLAGGQLEVLGRPVRTERDARRARRHLAYLEQDPSFPDRFTVVDAIAYAAWLHRVPTDGGAVEAVLERFQLQGQARTRLRHLSGGTRRRVHLAQAVVHDPRILVLDEPTVGMDIEHRAMLCDDLRAFAADRVVLLSTHLIDDLVALDARVVVLGGGTIAFSGDLDAVRVRSADGDPVGDGRRLLELGLSELAARGVR
jgi:ABC-2 type transport system ATP-binding protein